MENSQTESSITPFCFRRRRKSPLRSQTYLTLVRIVSACYKHPQLCRTAPIVPQELRPDNCNHEPEEASEKELHKHNDVVTPHGMNHDNSLAQSDVSVHENVEAIGFQDGGFSHRQTVIDEIENIMNTEEDEDPSKQKNLTGDDGTNGTGFQDNGFGQSHQLLMDEVKDLIKENKEVAKDKISNLTTVSSGENENQCGSSNSAYSNNQEENFDLQPAVITECKTASQQQVDKEQSSQNALGTVNSSLVKSVTCEVSKFSDNSEDKTSMSRTDELGINGEFQQKEMDWGKSVHAIGAGVFPNHAAEDAKKEEGEISGEFEVNLILDMPCDTAGTQEQRTQPSEDVFDRNKFPFSDKQEKNQKNFGSMPITVDMVSKATTSGELEANNGKNNTAGKRKIVVYEDPILAEEPCRRKKQQKGCEAKESGNVSGAKGKKKSTVDCQLASSDKSVSPMQNSGQTKTGDQGLMSKEKDAGACNKKKRSPPSEEKKAKKKEKKRKKRAQKNREVGVKRLKLRPVQNPKPVAYCRHYIKGRCHEGEKCKFSHDTIPLTKSKPCCHFVRHSCLKGDDCPFDHQLSKYPCTNYVSTGSCSRGEACSFSHKLPEKEDLPSTTNVCTPDLKPPSLPDSSNSKKKVDSSGTSHQPTKPSPDNVAPIPHKNTVQNVAPIPHKNTVQNVAKSVLSTPLQAPKGIGFLSAGKSSIVEYHHSTPGSSSRTRNEGFVDENKTDQNTAGTTQNSNDMPKMTPPAVAPKGINFLSFGKSPLGFSSIKNLACNSSSKLSLSNNFSLHKQSTLEMGIQVGKDTTLSVSASAPELNGMLRKNGFAEESAKSSMFSLGESSRDGTRCNTQGSLSPSSGTSVDRSVQASEISPNVHKNSSAITQGLRSFSLSSSQPADFLANACLKNTTNSAQKALISTLAFAAKAESEMKMKQSSVGAHAVSSPATNNESGDKDSGASSSSHNDSIKALKILDFLASVSGKMKQ